MDKDPPPVPPGGIAIGGSVSGASVIVGDHNRVTVVYGASVARAPAGATNPYRGLDSFDEASASFFFGREDLVKRLCERLVDLIARARKAEVLRFCAIIGPSGSGKSSIARAGLVPAVARSASPHLRGARVLVLRPGPDPIFSLADALDTWLATQGRSEDERGAALRRLEVACEDGAAAVAECLSAVVPAGAPLIILIDQFEEVYSLAHVDLSADERRQRAGIVSGLLAAARIPGGPISLIVTFRSDFFGAAGEHPDLNNAIARQHELVPAMSRDDLRRAILGPLAEVEREVGAGTRGPALIDDATIEQMLDQAAENTAALPLFQFALSMIWDGLCAGVSAPDTLKRVGGIGGALAHRADEVFASRDGPGRAVAEMVFVNTVQLADLPAYDTRKRLYLSEVATEDVPVAAIRLAIEPFIEVRLLVTGATPEDGVWVELPHEALIRSWSRLRGWTEEHREDLRFSQRLQVVVREWDRARRPRGSLWREPDLSLLARHAKRLGRGFPVLQTEFFARSQAQARRERRTRIGALAAILVLTIMAGIGMVIAVGQTSLAEQQRASADVALAQSLVANGRPVQALTVLRPYLADESSGAALDAGVGRVLMRALFENRMLAAARVPTVRQLEWIGQDRIRVRTETAEQFYSGALLLISSRPAPRLSEEDARTQAFQAQFQVAPGAAGGQSYVQNDEGIDQVFSPDRSRVVVRQNQSLISLRDAANALVVNINNRGEEGWPNTDNYRFSPDSKLLFLGRATSRDISARPEIVDTSTGARRFMLEIENVELSGFSPDSNRLVTYSADGRLILWATGRNSFSTHGSAIAAWSDLEGGVHQVRIGEDIFLTRRDASEAFYRTRATEAEIIVETAVSRRSAFILLATGKRRAELISAQDRRLIRAVETEGDISRLSFSPSGRYAIVQAASASWLTSTAAGRAGEWRRFETSYRDISFDTAEEAIAIDSDEGATVWDLATGRSLGSISGATGLVNDGGTRIEAAGETFFLFAGRDCVFAILRAGPPRSWCGLTLGRPVAIDGQLLILALGHQALRLVDPLASAERGRIGVGTGTVTGIRILNDRLAAITFEAANRPGDGPERFGLALVDYQRRTLVGRYADCVSTDVATCSGNIVYLEGAMVGTVRAVQNPVARAIPSGADGGLWLIEESGAVMAMDRAGHVRALGTIPVTAVSSFAEAHGPAITPLGDTAAGLCARERCLIADLSRGSLNLINQSNCGSPGALPRPDVFVCGMSDPTESEGRHGAAMFIRTDEGWRRVEIIPRVMVETYPEPWNTVTVGNADCQQWLISYFNMNAESTYAGTELWDATHGESLMHFEGVMRAWPRQGGGQVAAASRPRLHFEGRTIPFASDAIPMLCGREDAQRMVDALLARAGQPLRTRDLSWISRLRRRAFG